MAQPLATHRLMAKMRIPLCLQERMLADIRRLSIRSPFRISGSTKAAGRARSHSSGVAPGEVHRGREHAAYRRRHPGTALAHRGRVGHHALRDDRRSRPHHGLPGGRCGYVPTLTFATSFFAIETTAFFGGISLNRDDHRGACAAINIDERGFVILPSAVHSATGRVARKPPSLQSDRRSDSGRASR